MSCNKQMNQSFPIWRIDREFALTVATEFNIPFKLFALNLSILRFITDTTFYGDSEDYWPDFVIEDVDFEIRFPKTPYFDPHNTLRPDLYEECQFKIFSWDSQIESITVKSNKGLVTLGQNDPYFHELTAPIFKIKDETLKAEEKRDARSLSIATANSLRNTIRFLATLTSLNKFQLYVVVGLILVHYNLSPGKPLMTEEEYLLNQRSAQDYKHYLYDIVKSRFKKYFKE